MGCTQTAEVQAGGEVCSDRLVQVREGEGGRPMGCLTADSLVFLPRPSGTAFEL